MGDANLVNNNIKISPSIAINSAETTEIPNITIISYKQRQVTIFVDMFLSTK